jgi:hypothetical protein
VTNYRAWDEPKLEEHLRAKAAAEDHEVEFRVEEEPPGYFRAGFFIPGEPESPVDPKGVLTKGAEGADRQKVLADFAASLDIYEEQDRRTSGP